MNKRSRTAGVTLMEVLVVTGILSILFAIVFPVYRSAIDSAKRIHCTMNYRQVGAAMAMYRSDHDGYFPPANYQSVTASAAETDRSWVQTLLPYVGHFQIFVCPSDTGRASMPEDVWAGGTRDNPWDAYYFESLRSNVGFNFLYLSPLFQMQDGKWYAFPKNESAVAFHSGTILCIDSVWDRTQNGVPVGGGSWVTVPPCRYAQSGQGVIDTFDFPASARHYFGFAPEGWQPESSTSWLVYGGAWPWHRDRFQVLLVDGSVRLVSKATLLSGCDFAPEWRGLITSREEYLWDTDQ
ncbi:MAG: type II secretion system protein [Armatimonadetes bacterium]|nr:MAG: type II secretion system protein [Armatimonadota bacterium]